MKSRKAKIKKPLTEEQKKKQIKKRKDTIFKRRIRDTFSNMGFTYLPSAKKEFKIGYRVVELDYIFVYQNIVVICEDTCGKAKNKDHIRSKSESFSEILQNKAVFIDWLKITFPEKKKIIETYRSERFLVYYIYISQAELSLTDDERHLYSNLIFWEPETLAYFYRITHCLYYSARYEFFRFLKLTNDQIGHSGSSGNKTVIRAPIIYPEDATGLRNGVRVVSFMMSAQNLLRTSYVLRKDNWEESMWLYQRLVDKERIRGIRSFLASKGAAFYNNIIVALPDTIKFEVKSGEIVDINKIGDFQTCSLLIPDEMNSVCIIDGQHRIFAHYEAPETEKYEHIIAPLRKQLHLLVTGLVFPKDMNDADRKKLQSEIFLEINSNAKMVPADVLLHIDMLSRPLSDIGIARRVIERLNKKRTFLNKFELSALDEGKIKVASIIKFALRYLVTITPADGKTSLYNYWDGDKALLESSDESSLSDYIEFCAKNIDLYFSTIRDTFKIQWNDQDSKLLSVICINGFIIAFNRQLKKNGIRDYNFYNSCLRKLKIDYSKENFPYTSSQYRKFSTQILEEAFDFSSEEADAT